MEHERKIKRAKEREKNERRLGERTPLSERLEQAKERRYNNLSLTSLRSGMI